MNIKVQRKEKCLASYISMTSTIEGLEEGDYTNKFKKY